MTQKEAKTERKTEENFKESEEFSKEIKAIYERMQDEYYQKNNITSEDIVNEIINKKVLFDLWSLFYFGRKNREHSLMEIRIHLKISHVPLFDSLQFFEFYKLLDKKRNGRYSVYVMNKNNKLWDLILFELDKKKRLEEEDEVEKNGTNNDKN